MNRNDKEKQIQMHWVRVNGWYDNGKKQIIYKIQLLPLHWFEIFASIQLQTVAGGKSMVLHGWHINSYSVAWWIDKGVLL